MLAAVTLTESYLMKFCTLIGVYVEHYPSVLKVNPFLMPFLDADSDPMAGFHHAKFVLSKYLLLFSHSPQILSQLNSQMDFFWGQELILLRAERFQSPALS